MKIWIKNLGYILPAFLIACNPQIDVPAPTSGSVDFAKFVSVGNSLTAGYSDNGLYAESQMQSYPYLIARQISEIAPIDFKQPDIPGNGSGYIYLESLAPEFGEFDPDPDWLKQIEGPFNNLGVPGIRVRDIKFFLYGSSPDFNPYFYRMLGGKSPNTTYLEMVDESSPTFFTNWMGNNDVLGYATTGGANGIDGGLLGLGGLTPVSEFEQLYGELMDALTKGAAKGVVITIPDVTNIPFFTAVKWNNLEVDAATAAAANAFYAQQIDPLVREKVQEGVIELTVTEQAVSSQVVPTVAQGAVWQQTYDVAYQQAIDGGATPAEADAIATQAANDFVASANGMAAIEALETSLNSELRNHLLGDHSNHGDLEPLYMVIDEELENNSALQAGIAQGIEDLTAAYENGLLPPEQEAALDAAIETGTSQQIAALKAAGIYPVFEEGSNGVVIEVPVTETNPLGIRQMVEGELVLFTAAASGEFDGTKALEPKPDQFILTADEIKNINDYIAEYNKIIRSYGSASGVGVVEINDLLEDVNEGIFVDGVSVNSEFIQGGAFSLDAVHLTPRGYALVANQIIDKINSEFGVRISPVVVNKHRGVILP
ncbi:MAG: SGNH/GDSL hydrolase family protein [Cytophagales bacterium]|nr:SGNH/GDSL hydrolase family protein [Cytophagales bacterium]